MKCFCGVIVEYFDIVGLDVGAPKVCIITKDTHLIMGEVLSFLLMILFEFFVKLMTYPVAAIPMAAN